MAATSQPVSPRSLTVNSGRIGRLVDPPSPLLLAYLCTLTVDGITDLRAMFSLSSLPHLSSLSVHYASLDPQLTDEFLQEHSSPFPQLSSLDLRAHVPQLSIAPFLSMLAQRLPNLASLKLGMSMGYSAPTAFPDLSPLLQFARLSDLTLLYQAAKDPLREADFAVLRRMNLTALAFSSAQHYVVWSAELLNQLLEAPSKLRLKSFNLRQTDLNTEEQMVALLPISDSLESFMPLSITSACLPLLKNFRQLREVELKMGNSSLRVPWGSSMSSTVSSGALRNLTTLSLCRFAITSQDQSQLLQNCPLLASWKLTYSQLEGWADFTPALALRKLHLGHGTSFPFFPSLLSTLGRAPALAHVHFEATPEGHSSRSSPLPQQLADALGAEVYFDYATFVPACRSRR